MVSTNALELGVDIGALDVAVLVGYPKSGQLLAAAGESVVGDVRVVLQIARSEPVDQFLVHHPEYLREYEEKLGVDPDNLVLLEHVKCAAFELPFHGEETGAGEVSLRGESEFEGAPHVPEILDYLAEESGFSTGATRPGTGWRTRIRRGRLLAGGDIDNVLILEQGTERAIGETDRESSITTVHEARSIRFRA